MGRGGELEGSGGNIKGLRRMGTGLHGRRVGKEGRKEWARSSAVNINIIDPGLKYLHH